MAALELQGVTCKSGQYHHQTRGKEKTKAVENQRGHLNQRKLDHSKVDAPKENGE